MASTELRIRNEKISRKGIKRPAIKTPKPIEAAAFQQLFFQSTACIAAIPLSVQFTASFLLGALRSSFPPFGDFPGLVIVVS